MTDLLKLSLPVVLTYLGTMLMGFVDLILVGQIGPVSMGAIGVGTSIFAWFLVFGLGLSSGMEYLVAFAHGAKDFQKQQNYLVQGVLLSVYLAIPLTLILLLLSFNLHLLGVNPEVADAARNYSVILSLSLVLAYVFNVFRLYLTAMGIARPPMLMLVLGNLVNAGVGYMLVLGKWGMPQLGAEGAAWATFATRLAMAIGLGWYLFYLGRKKGIWEGRVSWKPHWPQMKEMIRVGLPSALQMTFEVGVFALGTTLAARLAPNDLAAHQITLNIASLAFMVPLGVGSATAVLVGQASGRREYQLATRMGWKGLLLGVGTMVVSCLIFLLLPEPILRIFTQDSDVILLGKSILLIAALFQLCDGIQVVGTGALRGLGETRSPMYFNLLGHWLVGLPISILLCFYWGWGLRGLWVGLSLGLTVVAAAVLSHWIILSRKFPHRA